MAVYRKQVQAKSAYSILKCWHYVFKACRIDAYLGGKTSDMSAHGTGDMPTLVKKKSRAKSVMGM